jgi:hypothetical protein
MLQKISELCGAVAEAQCAESTPGAPMVAAWTQPLTSLLNVPHLNSNVAGTAAHRGPRLHNT